METSTGAAEAEKRAGRRAAKKSNREYATIEMKDAAVMYTEFKNRMYTDFKNRTMKADKIKMNSILILAVAVEFSYCMTSRLTNRLQA